MPLTPGTSASWVAMLLTGHKSRAIFDRYNIIHEQELLDAGDQLVEYLAPRTGDAAWRAAPPGPHRRPAHRSAPPPRATHHRIRARPPPPVRSDADVQRRERLGGLLSVYYREAT